LFFVVGAAAMRHRVVTPTTTTPNFHYVNSKVRTPPALFCLLFAVSVQHGKAIPYRVLITKQKQQAY